MEFTIGMIIGFILGAVVMFYAYKSVAKMFRDDPVPSNLDGLRK